MQAVDVHDRSAGEAYGPERRLDLDIDGFRAELDAMLTAMSDALSDPARALDLPQDHIIVTEHPAQTVSPTLEDSVTDAVRMLLMSPHDEQPDSEKAA